MLSFIKEALYVRMDNGASSQNKQRIGVKTSRSNGCCKASCVSSWVFDILSYEGKETVFLRIDFGIDKDQISSLEYSKVK